MGLPNIELTLKHGGTCARSVAGGASQAAAAGGSYRTKSPVEEELEAAMAERDALLELRREKQEREKAEAAAGLARTRSAEPLTADMITEARKLLSQEPEGQPE